MASDVTLSEISQDTVTQIMAFKVQPDHGHLVATNAQSIAEAHFTKDAWFRAIYAGDTLVGFVMISDIIKKADYFLLWFMIDARYQRSNFGRRVTELLINHVRTRPNAEELYVSYHGGEGGPEGFYQRFEFEPTGEIEDGEIIAKMKL